MLGGADNPNGELLSYIIGADNFSGLYLYYHPAALLCRLICLNFINWLFGSL